MKKYLRQKCLNIMSISLVIISKKPFSFAFSCLFSCICLECFRLCFVHSTLDDCIICSCSELNWVFWYIFCVSFLWQGCSFSFSIINYCWQTDSQTDRQTDRQPDRQTDRWCVNIYIYIYLFFFDYVSHLYCISFLLFDFYNVYLVEQMKSILLLCSSVSFTFCEGKLERDRIQWEQG